MIGQQIGVVTKTSAAGLIAAGLLSVVAFPAVGLSLLRRGEHRAEAGLPTPANPVLSSDDRELCREKLTPPPAGSVPLSGHG